MKKFSQFNQKPKSPSKRRRLIILVLVLALLLISGVGALYINKSNDKKDTPQTADELTAEDETVGNPDFKADPGPTPTDDSDATLPPENKPYIRIQNASQGDGILTVTAETLEVGGSGKCVFTFTNPEDRPVVSEVDGNGSSCEAKVPSVEFAKTGIWGLNISYFRDQTKVVETNQNVTIN